MCVTYHQVPVCNAKTAYGSGSLKRYPHLPEIFLDHVIPGVVQFFVHGEDSQGGAGGALQGTSVVAQIDEQPPHPIRWGLDSGLDKQLPDIIGRQLEGESEGQGRLFPFHQFKTERAYFSPEGKRTVCKLLLFFCGEEGFLKKPVDVESVECGDCSFQKKKTVKGVA